MLRKTGCICKLSMYDIGSAIQLSFLSLPVHAIITINLAATVKKCHR